MKKNDGFYIDHILDSFEHVLKYIEGTSFDDFMINEEKQDAIIRKIEVAGEATKKLSSELRMHYQNIDWRAIAGMRDKLIHDYFNVDLEIVWEMAQKDIPQLLQDIKKIKQSLH